MDNSYFAQAYEVLSCNLQLELHCRRVALLVVEAAKILRLKSHEEMGLAAYLHDIGKTTFPPELFEKNPLEQSDWSLIKAHPIIGAKYIVEKFPELPQIVQNMVRGHHERPGGSGYPDGINEPGIETMLLAACDVYDAMTNERSYRARGVYTPEEALMEVASFAPACVVAALAAVLINTNAA